MPALVVALGPNNVEVPCIYFEERAEAEAFLDTQKGLVKEGSSWQLDYDLVPDGGDEEDEFFKAFFTSYYGGCGGVGGFRVVEPLPGKPFLCWDLD